MKQQRNTRQRQLVLDVVRGRRDHPTAEQIYQSVREQDAHVSRGTVYRNLNLLCDNREIYRVVMSNSDRFDLRTDPHYHIHCLVCDSVVDVPYTYDRAYDETLEQETGYRVLCHHMGVEGHGVLSVTRFFVGRRYSGYRPVRWQCIKKSRPKGRPKRVGYWKASSIMVARTDSIVNGSFCRMLSPFGALKFFVNFIHLHLVKCRGM